MPTISGILGRSSFGAFELAKPYPARVGSVINGAFHCDGVAGISWRGSMTELGRFHADGTSACSWTGSFSGGLTGSFHADGTPTCHWFGTSVVVGAFVCNGTCTVFWISGDGAVRITCVTVGASGPGDTNPIKGFILDAPFSY